MSKIFGNSQRNTFLQNDFTDRYNNSSKTDGFKGFSIRNTANPLLFTSRIPERTNHLEKLKWNEINTLDVDNLIENNEVVKLENLFDNLMSAKIEENEFNCVKDESVVKLFKVYQFLLDYFISTQSQLDEGLKTYEMTIDQIQRDNWIKQSVLQDNLKKLNKIRKENKLKDSMIMNFQTLLIDLNKNQFDKNNFQNNECKICKGKRFINMDALKSHYKRRHHDKLNTINYNLNPSAENKSLKLTQIESNIENLRKQIQKISEKKNAISQGLITNSLIPNAGSKENEQFGRVTKSQEKNIELNSNVQSSRGFFSTNGFSTRGQEETKNKRANDRDEKRKLSIDHQYHTLIKNSNSNKHELLKSSQFQFSIEPNYKFEENKEINFSTISEESFKKKNKSSVFDENENKEIIKEINYIESEIRRTPKLEFKNKSPSKNLNKSKNVIVEEIQKFGLGYSNREKEYFEKQLKIDNYYQIKNIEDLNVDILELIHKNVEEKLSKFTKDIQIQGIPENLILNNVVEMLKKEAKLKCLNLENYTQYYEKLIQSLDIEKYLKDIIIKPDNATNVKTLKSENIHFSNLIERKDKKSVKTFLESSKKKHVKIDEKSNHSHKDPYHDEFDY